MKINYVIKEKPLGYIITSKSIDGNTFSFVYNPALDGPLTKYKDSCIQPFYKNKLNDKEKQ